MGLTWPEETEQSVCPPSEPATDAENNRNVMLEKGDNCSVTDNNKLADSDNNKTTEVVKCNIIAVGRALEDGELIDVDERLDYIYDATKKLINQGMGRDSKKTCNICQHQVPSVCRHKEHCRGHFLQFVCPCSYTSHNKETTRRHQLRTTKVNKRALCARNTIYTIDRLLQ